MQVFDTAGEHTVELSQLIGHDGPVWQVTWAHPKFGSLLASCSLDQQDYCLEGDTRIAMGAGGALHAYLWLAFSNHISQ